MGPTYARVILVSPHGTEIIVDNVEGPRGHGGHRPMRPLSRLWHCAG